MKLKEILVRKIFTKSAIALVLALMMVFHPTLTTAVFVYAVEEGSGDANMETGDAQAGAEGSTEVNTNETEVSGTGISTDPCVPPEGTCEGDVEVETNNQADVDADTTADANTGINDQTDTQGDATMTTGDAGAGATTDNTVNTNVTLLDTDAGSNTLADSLEASGSAEEATASAEAESNGSTLETSVTNSNQADVDSDTLAAANTGENQQTNTGGNTLMSTGDATASANSLNIVNTNITSSNIQFLLLDIYAENADINLYEAWINLNLEDIEFDENGVFNLANGVDLRIMTVENESSATLIADTVAVANTGGNLQNSTGGDVSMTTGEAWAIANSVAFVNTNIIGTNILFGIINIFGSFSGNLILPNPSLLSPEQPDIPAQAQSEGEPGLNQVSVEIQNSAEVNNSSQATANSGGNSQEDIQGSSQMATGNAQALSNALTVVNSNIFANFFYSIMINNFGGWLGQIFGWLSPIDSADAPQGSSSFGNNNAEPGVTTSGNSNGQASGITSIKVNNSAQVSTNASASANTGGNLQNGTGGNSTMLTGNAYASANSASFVNTNIIGSNLFLGLINILGGWSGNLIFAHPDLAIDLSSPQTEVAPGGEVVFTATVTNEGSAQAHEVAVSNDGPDALIFQSSSSQLTSSNGNSRSWSLGDLAPGESTSFIIRFLVDPGLTEDTQELTYSASVTGSEDENMNNNSDSETVKVVFASTETEAEPEAEPDLHISSWNNTGEFMYAGDTVIFELTVENQGTGNSYDTHVNAVLINEVPGSLGNGMFELGTVYPNERILIVFEIQLDENGEVGHHTLTAWAEGKNGKGDDVSSNETHSEFYVIGASLFSNAVPGVVQQVQAIEPRQEVLGAIAKPAVMTLEQKFGLFLLALLMIYLPAKGYQRRKELAVALSRSSKFVGSKSAALRSFLMGFIAWFIKN